MRSTTCPLLTPLRAFWKRPAPVGNTISGRSVPDGALQYLVQTGRSQGEVRLAPPRDHFPPDLPPPLPIFFHAAQSLPSKRKSMSYRGEGPLWIYCDCSCCFGEGANGPLRKGRSESAVLTLPGTSFKAPSGRVFLGNTETFLTALAVHMRVVGRVSLLQDGHI